MNDYVQLELEKASKQCELQMHLAVICTVKWSSRMPIEVEYRA